MKTTPATAASAHSHGRQAIPDPYRSSRTSRTPGGGRILLGWSTGHHWMREPQPNPAADDPAAEPPRG
jgi:hypothetical protein